jgi:hypothetical protein
LCKTIPVSRAGVTKHRIYTMSFAKVYPLYVAKAERKGRERKEVDKIVRWLTQRPVGRARRLEHRRRLHVEQGVQLRKPRRKGRGSRAQ